MMDLALMSGPATSRHSSVTQSNFIIIVDDLVYTKPHGYSSEATVMLLT